MKNIDNSRIFLTFLLALCALAVQAQVGVGTLTPDASSQLDIVSTTKGLLVPRMISTERTAIEDPAEGLVVYQTDAPIGFHYFSAGQWRRLVNAADIAVPSIPSAYAANTSSSVIAVVLGGSSIPFPNAKLLSSGFTMDGSNTTLTVASTGRYQISYNLYTTASALMSSRITVNGAALPGSVVSPLISTTSFQSSVIVDLEANDEIQVQFYGLLGAATLAGHPNLSVVRLQ